MKSKHYWFNSLHAFRSSRWVLLLEVIFLSQLTFCLLLIVSLYPIHYSSFAYFGYYGGVAAVFVNILNTFLILLISGKVFQNRYVLVAPFIYAVSPWSNYLAVAGSLSIYILFVVLLCGYIFVIKPKLRPIVFALMVLGFIVVSFLSKDIVKVFSDPGLFDTINRYQGQAGLVGLSKLAKLSENRYVASFVYLLLKFTKNFAPSVFFTSEAKLLGFSFTPPLFLGFLIPFSLGLYELAKTKKLNILIVCFSVLTIPAVLSRQIVDLNRLVLVLPIVVFVISYGLVYIHKNRNKQVFRWLFILTIVIVVFQTFLTLYDIRAKEELRYERYFGSRYTIEL